VTPHVLYGGTSSSTDDSTAQTKRYRAAAAARDPQAGNQPL